MVLQHQYFAARRPAGTANPVTLLKDGVHHTQRLPDGTERKVIACGLACSECFSGRNLAKILQPGFDYEAQVMKCLSEGLPAPPLSIHTSSGVPAALDDFVAALQTHLPWKKKEELDWCVSLQMEGASAVYAAIDMVLQVNLLQEGSDKRRLKVAVGATSYHGPPSTSPGAKTPLWSKGHQVIYPVPTAYGSYDEDELSSKYKSFLDQHAHEIGVMLIEPQWGSSQAALPWPKHLLKQYVSMAKERGIKIVCDEIMCGLGRHGKGCLFISQAWDLDPDAVTFGKAIATGVFPLSGAILKTGRDILQASKCSVMQSHTYAGSSTRALMAATSVLKEFVAYLPNVTHLGEEMASIMSYLTKVSQGLFTCHGQGLMWGGIITHQGQCRDVAFRNKVVQVFKKYCNENCIIPYHVPVGGFMVSPVIDICVGTVYEIGERLEKVITSTMEEVGWSMVDADTASESSDSSLHIRAPSIASASILDLAKMANLAEAQAQGGLSLEQDLGLDKCVPHMRFSKTNGSSTSCSTTRCCAGCNKLVRTDVRTKFLYQ